MRKESLGMMGHQGMAVGVGILFLCSVQGYNNGAGAKPPMGINTWCTDDACGALDKCYEKELKSMADGLVSQGLDKLGYEYVNMDDCWSAETRNATGHLQADPKRFPSGMKSLVDYIHGKGLKVGLYTCVGRKTCRRGRPGSFGYYRKDAETMAGWGVDFVKADNCDRPAGYTDEELYANFSKALNATGRPMLFSLCQWGTAGVDTWGHKYGQMFRIQMDHLPFWTFPPEAAGRGYGQGVINIVEFVASLKPSTIVQQYGWIDPDFLETLFPITMSQTCSRTEYSMWAMWSAPLLVATDVRKASPELLSIIANKEVIAIDQDPTNTGADLAANNTIVSNCLVWKRPLTGTDTYAVAVVNPHKDDRNVTVPWTQLGLKSTDCYNVRDVWSQVDLGPANHNQTISVTHHDTAILKLQKTKATNCPPIEF